MFLEGKLIWPRCSVALMLLRNVRSAPHELLPFRFSRATKRVGRIARTHACALDALRR